MGCGSGVKQSRVAEPIMEIPTGSKSDGVSGELMQLLRREWLRGNLVTGNAHLLELMRQEFSHDCPCEPCMQEVLPEEVEALLGTIHDWDFNIWDFKDHTKYPIFHIGRTIFTKYHPSVVAQAGLDLDALLCFFSLLDDLYQADVVYHNAYHGADVTQSFFAILTQTGVLEKLQPLDLVAALVAAAAHDLGHPGVNNEFLQKTRDPLALEFNDRNVLENFHCRSAFFLMESHPSAAFLQSLDTAEYRRFRRILTDVILGTDMAMHQSIISSFDTEKEYDVTSCLEDAVAVLRLLLKAGDLGHTFKKFEIHERWSFLIQEEFQRQGDKERESGGTVAPLFDRSLPDSGPASNVGFFQFVVFPFTSVLAKFSPTLELQKGLAEQNLQRWRLLISEEST